MSLSQGIYAPPVRGSLGERFDDKVVRTERCWLWTAGVGNHGYGQIYTGPGKAPALAHRLAWEWTNGPIPANLEVNHLCGSTRCVRPDHMELLTTSEHTAFTLQNRYV